jgi:hypothetical protein
MTQGFPQVSPAETLQHGMLKVTQGFPQVSPAETLQHGMLKAQMQAIQQLKKDQFEK